MATVIPNLVTIAFNTNGVIAPAARMYWFLAGTSTAATVYSNSTLTTPHSQPIDANSSGVFPPIYAADGNYKVRITLSAAAGGATLYEVDNFTVASTASSLAFPTQVKTANFSVSASDRGNVFLCDASGIGGLILTITADSATLGEGFPFFVINTAATGTITIQGTGAQTIDGAATLSITTQNSSGGLVSIGAAGWQTVMKSNVGLGTSAPLDIATVAQYRANTASKVLTTDIVWSSAAEVTLTDAATIAVDMSTFINSKVTLAGNRTLGQPSNAKIGQAGVIRVIQDGTGSRTLAYHADWKFASGSDPVASTPAGSTDLLFYQVIATNFIYATMVKALA